MADQDFSMDGFFRALGLAYLSRDTRESPGWASAASRRTFGAHRHREGHPHPAAHPHPLAARRRELSRD